MLLMMSEKNEIHNTILIMVQYTSVHISSFMSFEELLENDSFRHKFPTFPAPSLNFPFYKTDKSLQCHNPKSQLSNGWLSFLPVDLFSFFFRLFLKDKQELYEEISKQTTPLTKRGKGKHSLIVILYCSNQYGNSKLFFKTKNVTKHRTCNARPLFINSPQTWT